LNAELFGWIGSFLLSVCGFPEVVKAIRNKRCDLSGWFIGMWGAGEIAALIYTVEKSQYVSLVPLLLNYGLNILFVTVFVLYKIRRKYEQKQEEKAKQ
jgi:hypothetical protein